MPLIDYKIVGNISELSFLNVERKKKENLELNYDGLTDWLLKNNNNASNNNNNNNSNSNSKKKKKIKMKTINDIGVKVINNQDDC